MEEDLLRQYNERLEQYEAMRSHAVQRLGRLLSGEHLKIHHITGRVKRPGSLLEKAGRKPGRYASVDEVTDVVAVRVITYFESDVSQVSRLLERNFEVDWDNSVDKSKLHDPDRFGYMGVHYVVRFTSGEFTGVWFEVQIRSILQHAWAEIEHDLGYKSRAAVPREIMRRFYRLAGLLEMADEEFMAIRDLKESYSGTLPARLASNPDSVFLDVQSMSVLATQGDVAALDGRVVAALGTRVHRGSLDDERLERITAALKHLEVNSAGQLLRELSRREVELIAFAQALMPQVPSAWSAQRGLRRGVSLVLFALWKACHDPGVSVQDVTDLLDLRVVAGGTERVARLAQEGYAASLRAISQPDA